MFLSAARTVPGTFFNGSVEFCGVLQFPFRFHFLSEKNDTDRAVYCPSQCLRKPARWRSEGDAYRSSKCEGRGTGIVNSRYADRELAQGARHRSSPFRPTSLSVLPLPPSSSINNQGMSLSITQCLWHGLWFGILHVRMLLCVCVCGPIGNTGN